MNKDAFDENPWDYATNPLFSHFQQQTYGKTSAYAQYGRRAASASSSSNSESDWTNIIPTISDNRPSQVRNKNI